MQLFHEKIKDRKRRLFYSLFLSSVCVLDGHNLGTLRILTLCFLLVKNSERISCNRFLVTLTVREQDKALATQFSTRLLIPVKTGVGI